MEPKKTKTTKMKSYMKHTCATKSRYSINNGVEEKKNVSPSPKRTPRLCEETHQRSRSTDSGAYAEKYEFDDSSSSCDFVIAESFHGQTEVDRPHFNKNEFTEALKKKDDEIHKTKVINKKLKIKIEKIELQNESFREALKEKDDKNTKIRKQLENNQEELDHTRQERESLKTAMKEKKQLLTVLQKKVSSMERNLEERNGEINKMESLISKCNDEKDRLIQLVHSLEKTNKGIINERDEIIRQYQKEKDKEIAHLNNRKQTLEQALENEQHEKVELITGNDLLRRKLQEEKDNVKKYQDRCKEGKDVINKLLEDKTNQTMIIDDLQDREFRPSVKDASRAMPFVPCPPQSNKINSRRPVKLQNDHEKINDIKKELDVEFNGMKEEMNVVAVKIKRVNNEWSRFKESDNMKCKHCRQLNLQVGYLQRQLEERENVIQTGEMNAKHRDSIEKLNLLRENKRLKTTSDSIAKRIEVLKGEMDSVNRERNEALTRIKELESEKDKHLKAVQYKFDRENRSLKQENERLKQDSQRIKELESEKECYKKTKGQLEDSLSNAKSELKAKLHEFEKLEEEKRRLKEENEHLKTEARAKKIKGENTEADLKLQHDNLRLKNEIEDLRTRFSNLYRQQEQEVKDCNKMNSEKVKKLETEIENNNILRKELSRKDEECKNLEIELGNMKLREKSKNLETISKAQQEKQRLQTELEVLRDRSETLEKDKYYFIEKCKSYEDLVAEKETLICQYKDENGDMRKEIQRVKDVNMELQNEIKEKISFERNQNSTNMTRLNHEKEQMTTALQNRIAVLTQDKDNISEKQLKLQKELQNQEEENETLRKEMARVKNENMTFKKEIEDKVSVERKNNADLTRLNAEKKQTTTDLGAVQNRLVAVTKEKDNITDKYMNLQKELQKQQERSNALRREITSLEAAVQDKDNNADKYMTLQKELQRHEEENNTLRKNVERVKDEKMKLITEMEETIAVERKNNAYITRLNDEKKQMTTDLGDLQNRLATLRKDKDHIADKYMTLQAGLQKLQKENNTQKEEIIRLEAVVQDKDYVADTYRKLQNELQNAEADNNKLRQELKRLQQLDIKSKKELGKCKSDIEETRRQMKTEVQERDKEEGRLQQELSWVKDENMKMVKEMEETISVERQRNNAYIKRLNDEKKQMTTDLGDLQNRLAALRKEKDHVADKYKTLQAGLLKLEEETNAYRKEILRLEAVVQDKGQIADMYKKLQSELQKAEADNNKLRQEMKRIEEDKMHLKEQLKEKISSEKRNEERNAYLVRLEKENEKLVKDLDIQHNRMEYVMKDGENINQKHARLFEKLQKKEEENNTLRKELISCKEKQETYQTESEIQASKAQETKEMVLNLQFQNNALHKDYEELKKRLSNEYRKNAQTEGDTNQLKRVLEDQKKELDRLSEEYKKNAEIAGQAKSLQRELAEQKKERESLNRELNRMKDILEKHQVTPSDGGQQLKDLLQENNLLKSDVQQLKGRLGDLQKQYADVMQEKDHALNRLSSVAGEKLRDNNPAIADLSDENRPINLGEKFTQLYDDQWTDAMENLEESLAKDEKSGIICLIQILKVIFEECVKCAENQFHQLQELTGMLNLPSDQLKKLKDLRKTSALLYLKTTKMQVKEAISKTFRRELEPCKSYIDRSTELCWLMAVQDPPVVIDFTAIYGQDVNDKLFRKFTKTGTKIDYLVWPMIRLHQSGPLLQKGVVQPI